MASKTRFLKHLFGGGWKTDYGPQSSVGIVDGNKVILPFLLEAQNVLYELDGGLHKTTGCTVNTAAALESGADIMGVYDAWFSGTGGTPTQRRILHVGTKIKKDSADDSFSDLFTGMTAGAVPCYSMLEDLLIMSNDSGTDVPKSWDLTTAQSLAGTPPTFAFSTVHKNKVWAAGAIAKPSRLYYSVTLNGADWAGAGSGTIDIDPNDGDRITGLASFRNELIVFKGPYKGSIHRITGSSSSDFAREVFVRGIGAVNHNTIVPYANDLAFMWSDGSIRNLSTTQNFGDLLEGALSRDIQTWLRDHLTIGSLRFAQAVDWPAYGVVLFALPIDASTSNNLILAMDYRFTPPRWSPWTSYDMAISLGSAVSLATTKARTVLVGGTDGKLRTMGSNTRTIDTSTPISFNVVTPYLDYDEPLRLKTMEGGSLTIQPKNGEDITFGWSNDTNPQQTLDVAQGGAAVLGVFLLGTSLLGGGRFFEAFFRTETGGEFRAIQFQVFNNADTEDVELHALSAAITLGAESFET